MGYSETGAKQVLVTLNRCRKIEYITIPHSNSSQNNTDGWLVSSCTNVPTTNAILLTP